MSCCYWKAEAIASTSLEQKSCCLCSASLHINHFSTVRYFLSFYHYCFVSSFVKNSIQSKTDCTFPYVIYTFLLDTTMCTTKTCCDSLLLPGVSFRISFLKLTNYGTESQSLKMKNYSTKRNLNPLRWVFLKWKRLLFTGLSRAITLTFLAARFFAWANSLCEVLFFFFFFFFLWLTCGYVSMTTVPGHHEI